MERKETPGILVWRVIYPFLVYFVIALIVQMIIVLPQSIDVINTLMKENLSYAEMVDRLQEVIYGEAMLLTAISSFVAIPVLYFFYIRDKKYWPVKNFVETTKVPASKYVYVILIGVVISLAFNHLFELVGFEDASEVYSKLEAAIDKSPYIWKFIAIAIAAPLAEELIFRGLMYKRLRRCLSVKTSMIVSAAAFGLTHGNIVQLIYAFSVGMLIAYVYEMYKNLLAPIIFHGCANFAALSFGTLGGYVDNSTLRVLIVSIEIALTYGAYVLMNKKMANNLISEEEK